VAAAKLRRSQMRLMQARPYADKTAELLGSVASLSKGHPLLEARENPKVAEFIILTSDRGLCGGFNGNLLRRIERFLKNPELPYKEVNINMIGKKGRDFFKARNRELASVQTGMYEDFQFEKAMKIANDFVTGFSTGKFDHLYLVYNHFKSAITQEVKIIRVLPVESKPIEGFVPEYIYEPSRGENLEKLIPQSLATMVYRAFLESIAGELGARMAAMDSATNNCSDLISKLTLKLNRARQATITTELMDIVNGAEAIK
jgi:F-type H+-transporting ATPase subunit gamma